jgi:hypothetical protein
VTIYRSIQLPARPAGIYRVSVEGDLLSSEAAQKVFSRRIQVLDQLVAKFLATDDSQSFSLLITERPEWSLDKKR